MENNSGMTALFSGRFDPVHLGHIISVLRLSKTFKKIIVVILDYPERFFPAEYSKEIFKEVFDSFGDKFQIEINNTHFGKITKEELDCWKFDVYCAGNIEVLNHIKSLGVKIKYVERAYEYEANNERYSIETKKFFRHIQKNF